MRFFEAVDQAYYRAAVQDGPMPVDDTGFDYDRFIPEDRVERPDQACSHAETVPDWHDFITRCAYCDTPVSRLRP